jgi:hypothetical protein
LNCSAASRAFWFPSCLRAACVCDCNASSRKHDCNCVQTVVEACMLLCESVIFICSILVMVWDMATNVGMEGYEDMRMYTVLCSMSTFFALSMTLSLLLVPTHVRSCSSGDIPEPVITQEHHNVAHHNAAQHHNAALCCLSLSSRWLLSISGVHE